MILILYIQLFEDIGSVEKLIWLLIYLWVLQALTFDQCFGSGSVRIRIIWPDPDPFQTIRIRIRSAKSIFCYISDYIENIVYMKKHCKILNRENKIYREKKTSDPDL